MGAALLVALGFLLVAFGWKQHQLRKIDLGGSSTEAYTLEQNLERIPILEAGLRLAPRHDALHVELGRTHLRIYEQKTAKGDERESVALAAQTAAAVAGELSAGPAPGAWLLALDAAPADLARHHGGNPERSRLTQEHLLPSLRHYLQARNLSPLNVQSHMGIAANADKLARGESFEAYLGRAKFLRPADPELWYRCGLIELKRQQQDDAWASWRHSLTLADKHLSDIVQQSTNYLSARELLDRVLPDRPGLLMNVARGHYGSPEQAAEQHVLLEHALGLLDEKGSLSVDEYRLKSLIYHLLGMEELARGAFKDAVALQPLDAKLRYEYASVLFQQGRYQECRHELARVLSLQPDHGQARELLASALKVVDSSKESDGMVTESLVDFGVVPHGTKLTHSFRVTNPTRSTLHVSGTRSSCGCARAGVERTEIPPGESMNVKVTLDSGRFTGPRTYTYYIDFDEPAPREVRLFARANSRTELVVDPPELVLDKQHQPDGTVSLTHHASGTWHLLSAEADGGALVTELRELSREDKQVVYQLRVRAPESTPAGNVDVWLKTDDASVPRIRVPVTIKAESATLAVVPGTLDLGRVAPGAHVERRVVVRGSQPFRIRTVEGADDRFQITGGSAESKPVQVLNLSFKPGDKLGAVSRKFRVISHAGAAAEFTVEGHVELKSP
jgi:tetratricopeptide (TPR) repeat protein